MRMKTKTSLSAIFAAALISATVFFAVGCNVMEPPEIPATGSTGRAFISVSPGGTAKERTVVPTAPSFSKYELEFAPSQAEGVDYTYTAEGFGTGVTVELLPGTYDLTVTVYQMLTLSGGTETEYLVGSGTASNIEITLGQNTVVPAIAINPGTDPDIKGIFSFTLTLPYEADSSTVVLQKTGGNPETITDYTVGTKHSMEVDAGTYDLFVTATRTSDGANAGYYTAVIVIPALESWAELNLSGLTLTAPTIVSFDPDGGTPTPEPITAARNGVLGFLPDAPEKENYTFSGWHTEQNGGGTEFTASTPVTEDLTVYAYWKQALGGTVAISGTTIVGQTLTAETSGLAQQSGDLHYQWEAGGDIVGEDSDTYTIAAVDAGKTITVTVTSSGNTGSVVSDPTVAVIPVGSSGMTITFEQLADENITLSEFIIYKNNRGNAITYPGLKTITLTNASIYSAIAWFIDESTAVGTANSVDVNATNLTSARHRLTVEVTRNGVPYSKTINFEVKN
jgi:uncharacterized repeat protein (TIGR02543 family)